MTAPLLVYDFTWEALAKWLEAAGQPAYRTAQIWRSVYRRLLDTPASMTDLPSPLRALLGDNLSFSSMDVKASARSKDGGTEKLLLGMRDGVAIEAVLMRYERRRTACISTQAGCAMGCVFCATGQMGFKRHLSAGEIVEQVLLFARQLAQSGERLTNIVVMGMGEPFHNYEATMEAIDRLNDARGFNFGARRFTVSTVGLIPGIERFTAENRQVNLAISLHAATDDLRTQLVPINRHYPLSLLLPACREYVTRTGRRLSFEWALIHGVNDTVEQADALAEWLLDLNAHVNLIPLNPTQRYSGEPSPRHRARAFHDLLVARGLACTTRLRRGIDIQAGCGQLATD